MMTAIREGLDYPALRDRSAGALLDHAAEFVLQRQKAGDPSLDLDHPRLGDRVRFLAGLARVVLKLQERPDGLDIEAEFPGMPDEREAPINAIWEGSGNVQCLDIARAVIRSPQTLEAYFAEVGRAKGGSGALDAQIARLKDDLRHLDAFEASARDLCDRLAVGLQAATLISAGSPVAEAFCRSRLETRGAHNYGALTGVDAKAIVRRAAAR